MTCERVAVVTGATSGIGRAVAKRFLADGICVAAVGRTAFEMEGTDPGRCRSITADLTDIDQIARVIDETVSSWGRIDILVNAAGIIANGSIETTSPSDWDAMMNVNLRSAFCMMQSCAPELIASKGCIVNVSSVAGPRAFPNVLAYCVSKAGLDQLTRCAALDLAPKGVRVNAVNPGVVVTNLHKRGGMDSEKYEAFLEHSRSTHPLGRVGRPEEIADLIAFLASDKAGWITGATYEIDGGRAQTCAR